MQHIRLFVLPYLFALFLCTFVQVNLFCMELHFRQKSIFVFDTRLAVFYATLHNATSNCVDFVVKLFDCTWYFLFFTFNITNLACQIDDFRLLLLKGQLCKFRLSKFCFQHPSSCIRLRLTSFRNPLREDIAGAANLHPHPHGNCGNEPSSRVE